MERQAITGQPRSSSEAVAQHQTKRRGFNLIEAAIVLGVVGAVIGGIWVAASAMIESYKVNKTVEGVFTIARNTQNLISIRDANSIGDHTYIHETLISSGAIPKDWNRKNPFGGTITVLNIVASSRFHIYLNEISSPVCVKLIMRFSSIGKETGARLYSTWSPSISYIGVRHGDVYWNPSSLPPSLEEITQNCYTSDYSKAIVLGFSYTRTN